jgi:SAM-dependent methyltransferase
MDYRKNKIQYLHWIRTKTDKQDYSSDSKYWGFQPIQPRYLKCLYDFYKDGYNFLDLGCGDGNVLNFAKNIGYNVSGVEYNKDFDQCLLEYDHIICDFTKLNTDYYNKFDFIYSYSPLKDESDFFFNKLVYYMKNGAVLYLPIIEHRIKNKRVEMIGKSLYRRL